MDSRGVSQAPLSVEFSRQVELPFPSPADLLDPGSEPVSPTLPVDSLLDSSLLEGSDEHTAHAESLVLLLGREKYVLVLPSWGKQAVERERWQCMESLLSHRVLFCYYHYFN